MTESMSTSAFELLVKFLKYVVYEKTKNEHLRVHIDDIEKLIKKIQTEDRDMSDIDAPKTFTDLVRIIIGWNDNIENQLYLFWDAYTTITQRSNETKIPFNPIEQFTIKMEKILQAQLIFENTFLESKKVPTEKLFLYSMFYFHIVNTDSLGDSLMNQFKNLLKQFNLENQYDVETIFSVIRKNPRGDKFDTDVRSIRNALAHLNYEIQYSKKSWLINFSMNEHGYNFSKKFTEKEFIGFLENSYYLYESQLALLWCLISLYQVSKFFGDQFPKRVDSF